MLRCDLAPVPVGHSLFGGSLGIVTNTAGGAHVAASATLIELGESEDALSTLVGLVGGDLKACNVEIVARMDSPVVLIPQLAAHIVAAGGKRLRPLLTLATARLCG